MGVFLGLGTNLGDRFGNLEEAIKALQALPKCAIRHVSSCYETKPVGVEEQPGFLNAVVEVETALEPLELLTAIKNIETRLGRRKTVRWGPRVLDIDILLWGDRIVDTPILTVPHREFRHRAFVLRPLAELAPNAVDPDTGATVSELLKGLHTPPEDVVRLPEPLLVD